MPTLSRDMAGVKPPRSSRQPSHVSVPAQRLEATAVRGVLGAARTLRDLGEAAAAQLDDDLGDRRGGGRDRLRARGTAQRAVARAAAAIEIQVHDRDLLAFD